MYVVKNEDFKIQGKTYVKIFSINVEEEVFTLLGCRKADWKRREVISSRKLFVIVDGRYV